MKPTKNDLLNQPPEKVLLMYRAVNDMINEGADITTMKVADITARAGIGKGTAYEYFSTKDEIITKALLHEMMSYLETITEIANRDTSFQEKVFELLDFGIHHFNEGRTFIQILKIVLGASDISDTMKQEFQVIKEENICRQFEQIQDAVMQAGIKENLLKERNKKLHRMVFNSQMITFTMMLHENAMHETSEFSLEEMKEFVYQSVIKLLN